MDHYKIISQSDHKEWAKKIILHLITKYFSALEKEIESRAFSKTWLANYSLTVLDAFIKHWEGRNYRDPPPLLGPPIMPVLTEYQTQLRKLAKQVITDERLRDE